MQRGLSDQRRDDRAIARWYREHFRITSAATGASRRLSPADCTGIADTMVQSIARGWGAWIWPIAARRPRSSLRACLNFAELSAAPAAALHWKCPRGKCRGIQSRRLHGQARDLPVRKRAEFSFYFGAGILFECLDQLLRKMGPYLLMREAKACAYPNRMPEATMAPSLISCFAKRFSGRLIRA